MALHWLIAAAVLGQIGLGLVMTRMTPGTMEQWGAYQLHKSIGVTILLASVMRLVWRLMNPVPPQPAGLGPWEGRVARAAHWGFYALLIGMPLTGWLLVSASPWNIPTVLFDTVPWPHLPLDKAAATEDAFKQVHRALGWLFAAMIALHVGAALRHHWLLKDDVLRRMLPVGGERAE
ncbi:MAG: cytochrome b [Sphingomonadales bacterium]|nr:cytochrome b [Sphingomonadales bacterium]